MVLEPLQKKQRCDCQTSSQPDLLVNLAKRSAINYLYAQRSFKCVQEKLARLPQELQEMIEWAVITEHGAQEVPIRSLDMNKYCNQLLSPNGQFLALRSLFNITSLQNEYLYNNVHDKYLLELINVTNDVVHTIQTHEIGSPFFSHDSRLFACIDKTNFKIKIWKLKQQEQPYRRYKCGTKFKTDDNDYIYEEVKTLSNNKKCLTVSHDYSLLGLYDLPTGSAMYIEKKNVAFIDKFQLDMPLISKDGSVIAMIVKKNQQDSADQDTIFAVKFLTLDSLIKVAINHQVLEPDCLLEGLKNGFHENELYLSPTGKKLVYPNQEKKVLIAIDTKTFEVGGTLPYIQYDAAVFNQDASKMVLTGIFDANQQSIILWDMDNGQIVPIKRYDKDSDIDTPVQFVEDAVLVERHAADQIMLIKLLLPQFDRIMTSRIGCAIENENSAHIE